MSWRSLIFFFFNQNSSGPSTRLYVFVSFCFILTCVLEAACHGQDRCTRSDFPREGARCHMVGDAALFKIKEIEPRHRTQWSPRRGWQSNPVVSVCFKPVLLLILLQMVMLSIYKFAVSEEFYVSRRRPCWVIKPLTQHLTGHSRTKTMMISSEGTHHLPQSSLWPCINCSGPGAVGVEVQREGVLLLICPFISPTS